VTDVINTTWQCHVNHNQMNCEASLDILFVVFFLSILAKDTRVKVVAAFQNGLPLQQEWRST
jgi:hypothetical protein